MALNINNIPLQMERKPVRTDAEIQEINQRNTASWLGEESKEELPLWANYQGNTLDNELLNLCLFLQVNQ